MLRIHPPTASTQVLLLHAPYPGSLKFDGVPSSLLSAIAPFAHQLAERGELEVLALLDPTTADDSFRHDLRVALAGPDLRALCISTSTAAIEEAAWAVRLARDLRGPNLLIVVGGPHEDDCPEKCAQRIPGVDLSLGGECEFVLAQILDAYLLRRGRPGHFLASGLDRKHLDGLPGGRVTMASPWWSNHLDTLNLRRLRHGDLPLPIYSDRRPRFSVFKTKETLPLMISRGCPYGRCTFCAEPLREGVLVRKDFDWIAQLAELHPRAAIYFQDSIFPGGKAVQTKLLPLLEDLGRPWGCQIYLPTLSRRFLRRLAESGCRYLYTGLESSSSDILAAVGKQALNPPVALERLRWTKEFDVEVGVSLQFGTLSVGGKLLETESSISATVDLAERIIHQGVRVSGFYPNITTVLPGTTLARGLINAGIDLDFYTMPRSERLAGFEDGAVGHNFMTIPQLIEPRTEALAAHISEAGEVLVNLGRGSW